MKTKKIAKYTKKAIKGFSKLLVLYFVLLVGSQAFMNNFSTKIHTQSQLETELKKERKRRGIKEDIVIHAVLSQNEYSVTHAIKLHDKEYRIVLSPRGQDLSNLAHELYHISDGHIEHRGIGNLRGRLTYYFWHEPKATAYQFSRFLRE